MVRRGSCFTAPAAARVGLEWHEFCFGVVGGNALASLFPMFVIEDEFHAEWIGEFGTREETDTELRTLASMPWNEAPNLCPCANWRSCGRRYHVIQFETSTEPWRQLSNEAVLEVSAKATTWL